MRDHGGEHPSPPPVPAGAVLTVGRERELVLVSLAIEHAVRGATHTLFLAGEAGIGKSRLLADAMQLMRDAGGLVALGRCLDERGMPPFFPWVDALTNLDEQLRHRLEPAGEPVIGSLATILLETDAELSTSPGGAEQRAFRQIIALSRALGKAASAAPILIAFDDLQWSDPASNQLLRYVATALVEAPVVLLGAYRTNDAEPSRELLRTLDELDRQRLVTTIRLLPITEDATQQLVEGLLGRAAPALGSAIHRQAAGNPFAIEEIVRAIAADERLATSMQEPAWLPEPAGVLALIRRRVDRLDPAVRELLEIAALTGRDISIELVRRVSARTPDTLANLFDAAVQAGLIDTVPDQPDRAYRFRHDRIRETIVAGIRPMQKQVLHARLAAAVRESRQFRDRLERSALLLHHLLLAGAQEEAAEAAEQLGNEAMHAHAFDQAAEAFSTALDMRRAGADSVTPSEEARLLLLRGDALLAASHPDAIAVLVEAEQCALASGDAVMAGRARLRRGRAHARREEHQLAVDALRSARESFAAAGRHDREALLADVELVAILGTSLGAYREAIEIGERTLATAAARPADPGLEAAVRLELAKTLMRAGQLAAGEAQLTPALGLALGAGALDLAAEISGAQANHAYWTGRLDLSERAARRRRDYAAQAGDPFAMRHARSWLATIAIARGDWAVARGLIAEATADVERIDSPEPAAFLRQLSGVIALSLGQLDEAVSCIEQAVSGFRQVGPATLPWYIGMLAHAYQAAGDVEAASEAVRDTERVIETLPAGALPVAPALAQLGAVAVLRHDLVAADRLYRALLPYSGQFHWVLIDRVLGMLARTLGDQAVAGGHLASAAAAALREGMRPEHALSMAGLAFDAARASESERTRAELDQAIARLRALGMEGAIRRLERLTGSGRAEAPASRPAGLTERELDVLRLVAQGMTNRDIGERLHISEKTVVNHLTHIYSKAGIENRAGAVMFAVRHGLIPG